MNELTVIPYKRELKDVTKDIHYQTGNFLRTAVEIGRLLFEAKDMVEYGKWGQYIEQELPFSHSWANNYMRLYKEFGREQLSIFGDSQVFMNLTPSNALEILKLPEEDRARFVEEKNVSSMSLREVEDAVKAELEQARAELRDAEQDKLSLQQQVAAWEKRDDAWEEEIKKQRDKATAARKAMEDTQKKLEDMTAKVKTAEEKAKESQKKLQDLKKNPEIPESIMAELRQKAQAEADKKAAADTQKEFERLDQELWKAEAALVAAEEKLARVQKQSQLSDPDTAVFKTIFQQVQEDFNRLNGSLIKIDGKDPEMGGKLRGAVKALLEKLLGEV